MVRRVAGGVRIHGGDPGIQRLLGRLPDSSIRPSSPMRRRARPQRHREYRIGSRYAHRCWRRTFTGLFLVSQVSAAPWVFSQLRVYGGQLRLTRYCAGCHRADPAAGGALPNPWGQQIRQRQTRCGQGCASTGLFSRHAICPRPAVPFSPGARMLPERLERCAEVSAQHGVLHHPRCHKSDDGFLVPALRLGFSQKVEDLFAGNYVQRRRRNGHEGYV